MMVCKECSQRAFREWAGNRDWTLQRTIPSYAEGRCPTCGAEQPPGALLTVYPGPLAIRIPMRDGNAALSLARWVMEESTFVSDIEEMPHEPVLRSAQERALADAILWKYQNRKRSPELLEYLRTTGRVCPMPDAWVKVHKMLGGEAPVPLILGGWGSPRAMKAERLAEHLKIAEERGLFEKVEAFLRGLPDDQWLWEPGKRPAREEARE